MWIIRYRIYRRMWLVDYSKNQLLVVHRGFCINMDEVCPLPRCNQLHGEPYKVIVKESICDYRDRSKIAGDLVTSQY